MEAEEGAGSGRRERERERKSRARAENGSREREREPGLIAENLLEEKESGQCMTWFILSVLTKRVFRSVSKCVGDLFMWSIY